jgi:hypothetical protein
MSDRPTSPDPNVHIDQGGWISGPSQTPDDMLLAALAGAHGAGQDVGEFVAAGLARLAALLGSSAEVTRNRPGSWEAEAVARLLASTVGPDDQDLPLYGGGGGSL